MMRSSPALMSSCFQKLTRLMTLPSITMAVTKSTGHVTGEFDPWCWPPVFCVCVFQACKNINANLKNKKNPPCFSEPFGMPNGLITCLTR